MKELSLRCVVALSGLLVTLCTSQSIAATLSPDTFFTLRSDRNIGPAFDLSSLAGGGGFTGQLSNLETFNGFFGVDRTYLEFDMSGFGGAAVTSATLDFDLDGELTDIITMGWYDANGIAELTDWSTSQTTFTMFNAGAGSYSIDITSLINSNLGSLDFIGFGFSIDADPNQAFFATSTVSVNFLSTVVVPIPAAAWLFGSGLLGLVGVARRKQTV